MEEGCLFCKCFKDEYKKIKKKAVNDLPGCKDHLHNWERWLYERKKVNELLAERVRRPKDHLLMNLGEEQRKIVEDKIRIINNEDWSNFNKTRGNPEWFKLPARFKQSSKDEPIIQAALNNELKGEVIPVIYIETPTHILKEKDILPRTRNLFALWQKGSYRQKVIQRIRIKMKFLKPHLPKLSKLVVIGHNNIEAKEAVHINPCTSPCKVTATCRMNECEKSVFPMETNIHNEIIQNKHFHFPFGFIVNGIKITPELIQQGKSKIRILFTLNRVPRTPIQKYIFFQNTGTTTLRISFHKHEKFRTFRDIVPYVRSTSPFYFNTNGLILLPFQQVQFPIWFKTTTTGYFMESWEITTLPKMWTDTFKLTAFFQGIIYEEDYTEKSMMIKNMLDSRSRYMLVREILSDFLDTPKYNHSQLQIYIYTNKERFESANMEKWGTVTRRKYRFDKDVVNELNTLYYDIRSNNDPPHWNYSVKTLKEISRKRDITDFIDNLHNKCQIVKERAEVLKQIYDRTSSKDILEESQVEITDANHKASDHNMSYTSYHKLIDILKKLERSLMIPNTKRQQYASAFFIWRFYMQKISKDLGDYNKNFVNIITKLNYYNLKGIEDLPERLIFERFDNIWLKRLGRNHPRSLKKQHKFPEKPKPTVLKHIPVHDVAKIYHAYTRRTSMQEETKKAARQSKRVSAKLKKNSQIDEVFDPYGPLKNIQAPPTIKRGTNTQKEILPKHRNSVHSVNTKTYEEKYLIVYTNLCAAVDAMVNTLETMTEPRISIPSLAELINCKVVRTESFNIETTPTIYSKKEMHADESYNYLVETYLNNPMIQKYYKGGNTLLPTTIENLMEYYTYKPRILEKWDSQQFLLLEINQDARKRQSEVQTSETNEFKRSDIPSNVHEENQEYDENLDMVIEDEKSEMTIEEEKSDSIYFIDSNVESMVVASSDIDLPLW